MIDILQVLLIFLFPIFSLWYEQKSKWSKWLSAIVLCYLVGILIRNLSSIPVNDGLAQNFTEGSIAIAIPLLLFGTRLKQTLRSSRSALISFALCIFAGLLSCFLAALIFTDQVEDSWKIGGMLVGIYTGGTPNMQAIGLALQVEQETIILLNAADIVTGGLYLILLTSFLPHLIAWVLPAYSGLSTEEEQNSESEGSKVLWSEKAKEWIMALGLSIVVLGITLGLSILFFGNMSSTAFIMLCLTTISIGASFVQRVEKKLLY